MPINNEIKIAFWGNSEFSLITLEEMKKLGILPSLIVTTPDKPQGRKMTLTPTLTKVWAENNSIEYVAQEKLRDESFIKKISEYDLFIVASYGKIIPKVIIDLPKYKILNIHPSLLPKYRGPSPIQTQILNDEKNVGVSIMLIDEQVDHGAIITQKTVEIANWPVGFKTLQEILAKEGSKILSETLSDWIKGKIKSNEQKHNEATFSKKVEKNDGLIDIINGNQYQNYLKILAYEEWPRAYFEIEKDSRKMKVIITKAKWENDSLIIERVIPEGKKEMGYTDFLRGISPRI